MRGGPPGLVSSCETITAGWLSSAATCGAFSECGLAEAYVALDRPCDSATGIFGFGATGFAAFGCDEVAFGAA